MELGDINDLPSEESIEHFLAYMSDRECCDDNCPFKKEQSEKIVRRIFCSMRCGKLFPKTEISIWDGPRCPCYAYGEEAIRAAQIMVDVYLG